MDKTGEFRATFFYFFLFLILTHNIFNFLYFIQVYYSLQSMHSSNQTLLGFYKSVFLVISTSFQVYYEYNNLWSCHIVHMARTQHDRSNRENDREKEDKIKGQYDRQCGIFDFSATTNPFSLRLRPVFKFITSTTISDHVILYIRRERNTIRRIKERESDRKKEDKIKGEYDRQCGIFDFSATTNPFSLRLGPVFKFITSTTISDHVISYTRRERNAMRRIKEREWQKENDDKVEVDCNRQYGIFDISASTNPFSLKLRPVFKFITSTTISDHIVSYIRL